jgi:hypothetical protein
VVGSGAQREAVLVDAFVVPVGEREDYDGPLNRAGRRSLSLADSSATGRAIRSGPQGYIAFMPL